MAIEGLDALMQKLDSMQGNSTAVLKIGVGRACKRIQAEAKANCPVDTGRLRASIVTDVQTDGKAVIGTVGTNVGYAPCVEFGTGAKGDPSVAHTDKKQWTYYSGGRFHTTKGKPPRPFLFPAYRVNAEAIKNDIKDAVAEQIIKRGG